MYHFRWEIEGKLARVGRPGREIGTDVQIDTATVNAWVKEAMEKGIKSVICLLGDDQLPLYSSVPGGLVEYYRTSGLTVAHIPTTDYVSLSAEQLSDVLKAYRDLGKPVLVHCSAGQGRSGAATEHIKANT